MRSAKKHAITLLILATLAAVVVLGLWYVDRPQFRARRLVAELRGEHPSIVERWLTTAKLMSPPQRSAEEIAQDLVGMGRPAARALVPCLGGRDDALRYRAVRILTRLGPDARDATDALIRLLREDWQPPMPESDYWRAPPEGIRVTAWSRDRTLLILGPACVTEALAAIGPAAGPALLQATEGRDRRVRLCAAFALLGMSGRREEVQALLAGAMRSPHPDVRLLIVKNLRWRGPAAVAALEDALQDENVSVRAEAMAGLILMAPPRELLLPVMLRVLKSGDRSRRSMAARVLAGLDPPAREAIPALQNAAQDEGLGVRTAADQALTTILIESKTREQPSEDAAP